MPTRVQSAIPMSSVCEPYIRRRAERHMEKGRVVIFAAGTGNPVLHHRYRRRAARRRDGLRRAAEGHPGGRGLFRRSAQGGQCRALRRLTYLDVLARDLAVMDAAAISLARENGLPIVVFNIHAPGAFAQVMRGEGRFTTHRRAAVAARGETGRGAMAADLNTLKQDLTRRMDGALETLRREFAGLRTGRASPALLEPVRVEAYGTEMPITQVGTIGVPEARMLTVQVWDRSMVSARRAGDPRCGLGLNPGSDGQLVRVPIPQLTAERRTELVKAAGRYAEGARRSPCAASAATAWTRSRRTRRSTRSARTTPRTGTTRCRS